MKKLLLALLLAITFTQGCRCYLKTGDRITVITRRDGSTVLCEYTCGSNTFVDTCGKFNIGDTINFVKQ